MLADDSIEVFAVSSIALISSAFSSTADSMETASAVSIASASSAVSPFAVSITSASSVSGISSASVAGANIVHIMHNASSTLNHRFITIPPLTCLKMITHFSIGRKKRPEKFVPDCPVKIVPVLFFASLRLCLPQRLYDRTTKNGLHRKPDQSPILPHWQTRFQSVSQQPDSKCQFLRILSKAVDLLPTRLFA